MTAAAAMEPTELEELMEAQAEAVHEREVGDATRPTAQDLAASSTRISDSVAFFLLGELVEHAPTAQLFKNPTDQRTADYLTGRFG